MEAVQFEASMETVAGTRVLLSLFQGAGDQKSKGETNLEFLLHLEAEMPAGKEQEKVQEAEFLVVVDRSGSMNGTPWRQVQGALCKMLELTSHQANIRCRVIHYNHEADILPLTTDLPTDKAHIQSIRAGGSTSFVSVFRKLSEIFQDKKEDSSKAFFVFFMTDGEDTCSNPQQIMKEKELMQTEIEKFGAEVVFHVLGFSDQHDEQFLESLTFLGTSDGSYSFVSTTEGDKAVEERLVQLIQSTSSVVGRSLNVEMKCEDLLFLGDSFGEGKTEVVVPAMVVVQGNTLKIATKKFVKKTSVCQGVPKLSLRLFEKLTGTPKAIEATVSGMKEIVLEDDTEVADHNLKKLRTAMNMVTGSISEAENSEEVEKMKMWHQLVREKFSKLNIDDKKVSQAMLNRKKAVQSGINICNDIYEAGNECHSERDRMMKQQAAGYSYQLSSNQVHNRKQVKSKDAAGNRWLQSKGSRSSLQRQQIQADYTVDDYLQLDTGK